MKPDDPNNFENDNYKAAQIDLLAPLPDLVVTSLTAPGVAKGGENVTINWTVANKGNGIAQPTGWIDTVYLTNDPTNPLDPNAITLTLGSVAHNAALNPNASYNASLSVELSPSAVGQYFVVYTDAPQPAADPTTNVVTEVSEANNLLADQTSVTPVPADLVVTNVSIPTVNYSGEVNGGLNVKANGGPGNDTVASNLTISQGSTGKLHAAVFGGYGDDHEVADREEMREAVRRVAGLYARMTKGA